MEYLQYGDNFVADMKRVKVLNLIINGIPSILAKAPGKIMSGGFKPYYKWNTFNTQA